jgi:3-oxoacyl-[acyl-carrier protein] reductase
MTKRGSGTIINVSSGAGKSGFPKLSAYCASKFGIIGLSESLVGEVSNHNDIRLMALCPGEINTGMIEDAIRLGFRPHCKKNDMYKPEDAGQKILEMIIKDKEYVNGQCVEFYSGMAR